MSGRKIGAAIGGLFLLLFFAMLLAPGLVGAFAFVFQTVFYLAVGWIFFLVSVLPEVRVSTGGIVTALLLLGLFGTGLHLLLQRIAEAYEFPEWRERWTAAICGIIVLAFTAGIAITGATHQTGWLLSSPEPLLQNSFDRLFSAYRVRELGSALPGQEPPGFVLPHAVFDEHGRAMHSWAAQLLPYLGKEDLAARIDHSRPWDAAANEEVMQSPVPAFLNPRLHVHRNEAGYGLSHYAQNVHLAGVDRRWTLDGITDGASETILFGEVNTAFRPWGDPVNWRDPALGLGDSADRFGSQWETIVHFAMADGSDRSISSKIDPSVLAALATPAAGEKLPERW